MQSKKNSQRVSCSSNFRNSKLVFKEIININGLIHSFLEIIIDIAKIIRILS